MIPTHFPPISKNIPERFRKFDRLVIPGQHCGSILPHSISFPSCCQRRPIAIHFSSIYSAFLVWQPCFKDAFTNHRVFLRVKITFSNIFLYFRHREIARVAIKFRSYFYIGCTIHPVIYIVTRVFVEINLRPTNKHSQLQRRVMFALSALLPHRFRRVSSSKIYERCCR